MQATADLTYEELLAVIEREEFDAHIRPLENPRDLLTFARSLYLPPARVTDVPEIYNPDGHIVQRIVLDQFTASRWREFVIVACTQDGKSWLVQILLFWAACELRESVIMGGPDMRIAQDTWRAKTKPAMEASGLKDFLPVAGPGSAGGSDVDTVQLNGGGMVILLGAGGKNKSGQAGRTSRLVIVDEFGKIKPELAGKFDRRADSFGDDGRLVKAGTVEQNHDDPLLDAYDLSSRGRFVWRCHHCQKFTHLEWDQVTADYATDYSAAQSVRIACATCGALWTDAERKANLRDGRLLHAGQIIDDNGIISGPNPETFTCGIRWTALDSPRRSLAKLAVDYRKAKIKYDRGDAIPLTDFYNDQLAAPAPIDDGTDEMDAAKLAARSSASNYECIQLTNERGDFAWQFQVPILPDEIQFTTVAVDQSLRRLWYIIRGHNADGRSWWLGYGRVPICGDLETPTKDQRFAALDQLHTHLSSGIPNRETPNHPMTPAIYAVDCGDFLSETFEWLGNNPAWLAIRGTGDRQFTSMSANTGRAHESAPGWYTLREYDTDHGTRHILWIDSDRVKTEFSRSLQRPLDGPGSASLPRGLTADDPLIQHLTAEQWLKAPGGRFTWVKKKRFNDLWDLGYYTQCLPKYVSDKYPSRTTPTKSTTHNYFDETKQRDHFGGGLGWL